MAECTYCELSPQAANSLLCRGCLCRLRASQVATCHNANSWSEDTYAAHWSDDDDEEGALELRRCYAFSKSGSRRSALDLREGV